MEEAQAGGSSHYDFGIVGVWMGCNYGSIATYYALNRVVTSFGKSVLMIDKPAGDARDAERQMTHSRRFANEHYVISRQYRPSDLGELNRLCDGFIVGSDQVWNYGISRHTGKKFYLDFAADDKKKIAYAASFGHGVDFAPEAERQKIAALMRRFDAISVRESGGVTMCRDMYGVKAEQVLDPVFLPDRKLWDELADRSDKRQKGRYLLTYLLDPTEAKRAAVLHVAEKLGGIRVINVLDGLPWLFKKNRELLNLPDCPENVQVEDWLCLIRDAEMVMTDSCHGLSFALIFQRNFVAFVNRRRGYSRFASLAGMLGFEDRLVLDPQRVLEDPSLLAKPDHRRMARILKKERKRSLKWLKEMIRGPRRQVEICPLQDTPESTGAAGAKADARSAKNKVPGSSGTKAPSSAFLSPRGSAVTGPAWGLKNAAPVFDPEYWSAGTDSDLPLGGRSASVSDGASVNNLKEPGRAQGKDPGNDPVKEPGHNPGQDTGVRKAAPGVLTFMTRKIKSPLGKFVYLPLEQILRAGDRCYAEIRIRLQSASPRVNLHIARTGERRVQVIRSLTGFPRGEWLDLVFDFTADIDGADCLALGAAQFTGPGAGVTIGSVALSLLGEAQSRAGADAGKDTRSSTGNRVAEQAAPSGNDPVLGTQSARASAVTVSAADAKAADAGATAGSSAATESVSTRTRTSAAVALSAPAPASAVAVSAGASVVQSPSASQSGASTGSNADGSSDGTISAGARTVGASDGAGDPAAGSRDLARAAGTSAGSGAVGPSAGSGSGSGSAGTITAVLHPVRMRAMQWLRDRFPLISRGGRSGAAARRKASSSVSGAVPGQGRGGSASSESFGLKRAPRCCPLCDRKIWIMSKPGKDGSGAAGQSGNVCENLSANGSGNVSGTGIGSDQQLPDLPVFAPATDRPPRGKFLLLPLERILAAGVRYRLEIRIRICSAAPAVNLHIARSSDSRVQVIRKITECSSGEWGFYSIDFTPEIRDADSIAVGASQFTGPGALVQFGQVTLRQLSGLPGDSTGAVSGSGTGAGKTARLPGDVREAAGASSSAPASAAAAARGNVSAGAGASGSGNAGAGARGSANAGDGEDRANSVFGTTVADAVSSVALVAASGAAAAAATASAPGNAPSAFILPWDSTGARSQPDLPSDVDNCRITVLLLREYGVRHVVLSSGKRHLHLAAFMENCPDFTVHRVVDERSAAFYALGIAAKLREPVVCCCTSGTAVSNYLSAVTEASYQQIPLICLTADRYPHLLNQREDQMIPQEQIFGDLVRKAVQLPVAEFSRQGVCRRRVCEALTAACRTAFPGPVQINVPVACIRKLTPEDYSLKGFREVPVEVVAPGDETAWEASRQILGKAGRILVIWGQSAPPATEVLQDLAAFCHRYGAALVADHLGNIRGEHVISAYRLAKKLEPAKADPALLADLAPDVVITIGGNSLIAVLTKNMLKRKLRSFVHWDVSEGGEFRDPYLRLTRVFRCRKEEFLANMVKICRGGETGAGQIPESGSVYPALWRRHGEIPFQEPAEYGQRYGIWHALKALPAGSSVHVANSLSVRIFCECPLNEKVTVFCNRGVNGIDGSASSFMGQAMVSEELYLLLIGDLSFFYDMNAFWDKPRKGNMRIMLLNNGRAGLLAGDRLASTTAAHSASAEAWIRSQGFRYLSSRSRREFAAALKEFYAPSSTGVFFEVFC